jgi:hypothetical protein
VAAEEWLLIECQSARKVERERRPSLMPIPPRRTKQRYQARSVEAGAAEALKSRLSRHHLRLVCGAQAFLKAMP